MGEISEVTETWDLTDVWYRDSIPAGHEPSHKTRKGNLERHVTCHSTSVTRQYNPSPDNLDTKIVISRKIVHTSPCNVCYNNYLSDLFTPDIL